MSSTENDPCLPRLGVHSTLSRLIWGALILFSLVACGSISLPEVHMPQLPGFGGDDENEPAPVESQSAVDVTATPRDLLSARLVNPRADPETPNMTVGKLIEYADRYLACDCSTNRFVRDWEKTPEGYRLTTNSGAVRPLDFVCKDADGQRECYLEEIDRGPQTEGFTERFVPGADFIQFVYENGVRCDREEPCP